MRKLTVAVAALLLAACSKDIQNSDAVKQGVMDYLQQRTSQTGLNMNMMQVDVVSVSFDKNQARAVVMFRPKNSPDAQGMQMNYTLDRQGNKWVVQPTNAGGANPHGGSGAGGGMSLPSGHPATGGAPPAGGEGKSLPPGHPPVSPKQ